MTYGTDHTRREVARVSSLVMTRIFLLFITILLAALISACSTWDKLDNRERGAVIGVGSGAAVGSAVGGGTGAVLGGVGGGVAGGVIGNEMDKDERDD